MVEVRIDGLPPKKDGANSMWNKPVEVERLIRLRRAVLDALGGSGPYSQDISLRLEVHVGPTNTRQTGDLDNVITGVCDGLTAAHPGARLDKLWEDQPEIEPSRVIGFEDDSQVMSITARKVVSDEEAWYRLVLDGKRSPDPGQALGDADAMFAALVDLHRGVAGELPARLGAVLPYLVRDAATKKPVWESYIPFIGPRYREGGVLVVATAQNLARWTGTSAWRDAIGGPGRELYRLYRLADGCTDRLLRPDEVGFRSIAIAPWLEGIIAALVGLALRELGLGVFTDLNEVTQRVAVTNFFKHSLQTKKGTDLNPLSEKLPAKVAARFKAETARLYVKPEVRILRPRLIIAFKKLGEVLRRAAPGATVLSINDPSWIKQGMSGVAAAPSGSWLRRVKAAAIEPEVEELVRGYRKQMAPNYQAKSEAVRVYLLCCWLDLKKQLASGSLSI